MNWQALYFFGSFISATLYSEAFFVDSTVEKITLDKVLQDLKDKGILTIKRCSLGQTQGRRDKEDIVKMILKKIVSYVEGMCAGDIALLQSSGFNVVIPESNTDAKIFTVVNGEKSGEVIGDWPSDVKARSYNFRYCVNTEVLRNVYTQISVGTTGCTVSGLVKGTEYAFSMSTVYADHESEFCDPVILVIL